MPPKSKSKTVYICNECGYESPKWMGRCPECQCWNTFEEEVKITSATKEKVSTVTVTNSLQQDNITEKLSEIVADESSRHKTHISEFDRVLGGGIVKGAAVLVCGDPGIGKSTILLQMCRAIEDELNILYICGEESMRQVKLRANRLGLKGNNVSMTQCTDAEQLIEIILKNKPQLVIVDSIQTISVSSLSSSCGSITQVRESAQLLMNICKSNEIPLFIVGHVNKDGGIAGPKVLEHMVDTVLYFEGDRNLSYRILRSIKNRFGSTNEIGVFEMNEDGLSEVTNPSEALLNGRPLDVSGTCITCLLEGTRPILLEVQALVSKTSFGTPRRVATGFDYQRMGLLIAVIEKRAGYFMGNLDVFVNVTGGMRIDEPSADLSVCLSLISNLIDKSINSELIAFGEVGLTGEVRSVSQLTVRMSEAYRLGFRKFIIPKSNFSVIEKSNYKDAQIYTISNLSEAINLIK